MHSRLHLHSPHLLFITRLPLQPPDSDELYTGWCIELQTLPFYRLPRVLLDLSVQELTTGSIWGLIPMSILHPYQKLLRLEWDCPRWAVSDVISRSFNIFIEQGHGTWQGSDRFSSSALSCCPWLVRTRKPYFLIFLEQPCTSCFLKKKELKIMDKKKEQFFSYRINLELATLCGGNICWCHQVPPSLFHSSFVHLVGKHGILLQFLYFRTQVIHT